jgi:hypothetical protein
MVGIIFNIGLILIALSLSIAVLTNLLPRKYFFNVEPKIMSNVWSIRPWLDLPSHMLNKRAKNIRVLILMLAATGALALLLAWFIGDAALV